MKRRNAFLVVWIVSALPSAPLRAETGNLVPNGRFDAADGIAGWQVDDPAHASLDFDPTHDADACSGSGSALATADPPVDYSTVEFSTCLGPASSLHSYWFGGEILFAGESAGERANLTLTFYDDSDCTGNTIANEFAGYARSEVAGWQPLAGGPAIPPGATQSAKLRVLLTQIAGADPPFTARFDEIRVTITGGLFAEDYELGAACRWDATLP